MSHRKIPAAFYRGGTSKGLFFRAEDLPADRAEIERILLAVMGSPDPYRKQMDGMGGGTSSTSKALIVSPSTRADCDVDYWFAQVGIDTATVDWSGNCGNLTSAVGPFAIEEGMVAATGEMTTVRMWQANLGKRIIAQVPTKNGLPRVEGDYALPGVGGTGAEIVLSFLDPSDAGTGLLPTGRVMDTLDVPGVGKVEATLINAGNPHVFVAASTFGITAAESVLELDARTALHAALESTRTAGAVTMGLAKTAEEATRNRPATPKIALFAAPCDYENALGEAISAEAFDVLTRIVSMGRFHHAFPGTAGVSVAAAARLPGTLVHRFMRQTNHAADAPVRIAHASGVLPVGVRLNQDAQGAWVLEASVLSRTARRLMEGSVLLPV